MSTVTEPVVKASRQTGQPRGGKDWLEALASGACDQAQFIRGVDDLVQRAPEAGWELLGLVDQYFRRGKLSAHSFSSIKTHLQSALVGKGNREALSNPLPRMQGEPPGEHAARPAVRAVPLKRAPAPAAAPAKPSALRGASAANRAPPPNNGSAPEARHMLAVGEVLRGRYLVQGLLGQGGMGVVYAAVDQFLLDRSIDDQKIALKVLHTEVIKRPRLFAELRREFQHLQSLSHPNIVRVHEFDRDGDMAFFTMEYLSGSLLSAAMSAQPSSALYRPYALAIIRDVGSAVAHAHARGVVHGDLNPGNIFITDNGEVRVLDFGASHQLHRGPWISEFDGHERVAVATPGYASCQVLEGEPADARDDVYALACIAYVLLTGQHPYRTRTPLHARTLGLTPDRPRGLTKRQWKALRAGLSFDRDRRPPDLGAWLAQLDLRTAVPHLPALVSLWTLRPGRPRGRIWVPAAAAAALCACGWFAAQHLDSLASAGAEIGMELKSMSGYLSDRSSWRAIPAKHSRAVTASPAPASSPPAPAISPPAAVNTRPAPESLDARQARSGVVTEPAVRQALPAPREAAARSYAADPAAPPASAADAPAPAAAIAPAAAAPATDPRGQGSSAARARIEMGSDSVEVMPAEAMARVVVRRSRNLRGDVSFTWWTESGTAKPGRDFVPVKMQVEHIENGQSAVSLVIPVVVDPARRDSRSFYVVIDDPSDNAALGSRNLAMITLPGSDPPGSDSP